MITLPSAVGSTPYVVIVTGWRGARAERHGDFIAEKLQPIREQHPTVILRHGKCPYGGVDLIADGIGRGWGWEIDKYPPEIANGRVLGSPRNRDMCAAVPIAELVVAFPGPESRGTWNCLQWATRYGIPFRGYGLKVGGAA